MRALSWMVCLWPGFAALWLRGRWTGLVAATAFSALLNLALVTTFAGPFWSSSRLLPALLWVLVLGFWVLGWRSARRTLLEPLTCVRASDPQVETLLAQAQTEYLKGHWIDAETLLEQLFHQQPDDIEGRLLLGTVQRRMKRLSASQKTLTGLSNCLSAARWTHEIRTELARLSARQVSDSPEKPIDQSAEDNLPLARAA